MNKHQQLINSTEFNDALNAGAELRNNISTTYKIANKSNYKRFEEVMYEANSTVKKILDTKKKNRTPADIEVLKEFKKTLSTLYKQTQDLCTPEKVEEGKKSKIEKIVDKIIPVIDMLRYIDNNTLEAEFNKRGLSLVSTKKLEDKYPALNNDDKREVLKDIFNVATSLKTKVIKDNDEINVNIFTSKVPIDLQYDKDTNNSGLKPSDFRKLVDVKAKLLAAKTDEAKEKVDDKIEKLASDKQFEVARAELVRDKLTSME